MNIVHFILNKYVVFYFKCLLRFCVFIILLKMLTHLLDINHKNSAITFPTKYIGWIISHRNVFFNEAKTGVQKKIKINEIQAFYNITLRYAVGNLFLK